MYVCVYACMCECMHVCMYSMYVCMYACMCVCMYVYMYACRDTVPTFAIPDVTAIGKASFASIAALLLDPSSIFTVVGARNVPYADLWKC